MTAWFTLKTLLVRYLSSANNLLITQCTLYMSMFTEFVHGLWEIPGFIRYRRFPLPAQPASVSCEEHILLLSSGALKQVDAMRCYIIVDNKYFSPIWPSLSKFNAGFCISRFTIQCLDESRRPGLSEKRQHRRVAVVFGRFKSRTTHTQ